MCLVDLGKLYPNSQTAQTVRLITKEINLKKMEFKKIDKYYWRSEVNYHLSLNYCGDDRRYMMYDCNKIFVGVADNFLSAVKLANTHFMMNQDD